MTETTLYSVENAIAELRSEGWFGPADLMEDMQKKYFDVRETLGQVLHAHKSFNITDERWNEIILDADRVLHDTEN